MEQQKNSHGGCHENTTIPERASLIFGEIKTWVRLGIAAACLFALDSCIGSSGRFSRVEEGKNDGGVEEKIKKDKIEKDDEPNKIPATEIIAAGVRRVLRTASPGYCNELDDNPPFIDTARERGLTHSIVYSQGFAGPGVCLFDYDRDYDSDLYFVTEPQNILYENDDGHFLEVSDGPAGPPLQTGCLTFDYDNDGYEDLLALGADEGILYHNTGEEGDFSFVDVTNEQGIFSNGRRWGATAGDIENDGDLDLGIGGYDVGFGVAEGTRDLMFVNEGGSGFREEGEKRLHGATAEFSGFVFTPLFIDLNRDGFVDYASFKDLGLVNSNEIYVNDGNGNFENRAAEMGLDFSHNQPPYMQDSADSMGVDIGDWDLDGVHDLLKSNYVCRSTIVFDCQWKEEQQLFCEDIARDIGFTGLSQTNWGIQWDDFDLDGDLDVFNVAGFSIVSAEDCAAGVNPMNKLELYWNVDGKYFSQYVPEAGEILSEANFLAYGLVTSDLDSDFDIDVVPAIDGTTPPLLLENCARTGNAIAIEPRCTESNTACIGAWVKIETPDGHVLEEPIFRGGNFAGTHARPVTFGLAGENEANVTITWPNQNISNIPALEANALYEITEGDVAREEPR